MPKQAQTIQTHATHIKPPDLSAHIVRCRSKPEFPPLPTDPEALARLPQVLAFAGIGRTRLYELIKKKLMPEPFKVGRSSFWRVGEVREAVKKLSGEGGK